MESQMANLDFLEDVYKKYQAHPAQVDPSWKSFFQQIEQESDRPSRGPHENKSSEADRISALIDAYRHFGHLIATINPIAVKDPPIPDQLQLQNLGFQPEEIGASFPTHSLLPQEEAPLDAIVDALKNLYCKTIGFEFKGIVQPEMEEWIQTQIESGKFNEPLKIEDKLAILDVLTRAEVLETFLHTKHVGKKRFSLEGSETLVPMLVLMMARAADVGVEEFYIGMSHRGRLNILANLLNKPLPLILKDFDDEYVPSPSEGMGDIRYHTGHANESVNTYRGKKIKLTMAPNPSHLESVNPVVEGQTHAGQFLKGDEQGRNRIIPLLMHGDAALAAQGVVYETLQLCSLPGFETGGTLNIVINNQIGFTTTPAEGRSTFYCTDIAKTFGAPVLHVNGEDPEMCVRAALFAFEIRHRFHSDVFIDLNCYRKYGHNEGDEPAFTQPLEYKIIRQKKSIRTPYLERLVKEEHLDRNAADAREDILRKNLQESYESSRKKIENGGSSPQPPETIKERIDKTDTQVGLPLLKKAASGFSKIPPHFHLHPKLEHLFHEREKAVFEDLPIDWGTGEFLAYATLVLEGIPVRLAGQDSGRGTFSHRHALWIDQEDSSAYYPLAHVSESQARFEVLNTCLSEVAALGFEYGYSTVCTQGLNIWEAQFGDFVNSAQVIIDQYIASGEQKWGQKSNLVLFLPHGFEGQGPEHSSARFERFLALAGHENMQITYPTTPAQLFHLLRRQVKQPVVKPLIVLTPKGLLRHPACTSRVADLTDGGFSSIIEDPSEPKNVRRLILCSGRIYYDLAARREKQQLQDIAMIRLEQLYPLDIAGLKQVIGKYGTFQECLWVQEEPENMGAWPFISFYLPRVLPAGIPFSYNGRERSASPATGFYARHSQELANILNRAFEQ